MDKLQADNIGTKVPTVSSAQCRFVATIPVGPLFNHPTTYSPVSTVAVSDSLLNAHESTSQVWHNS